MKTFYPLQQEAQQKTAINLEHYLQKMRHLSVSNDLDSNRHKIRLYLAETLQDLVKEQARDYAEYYQLFVNLFKNYQRADPIFAMDETFEVLVKFPLEKHAQHLTLEPMQHAA
ncbi:MAG: hypothetical protein QM752_07540 [Gammaproteobacteria bacterium]